MPKIIPALSQDNLFRNHSVLVSLLFFGVSVAFIGSIALQGIEALSWQFIWDSPKLGGKEGGIFPIIVSTIMILAVCMIVAIPLSIASSIYIAEIQTHNSRMARFVLPSLDILAATPSIVFGLFGNAFFTSVLDMGYSILSGGLTLCCMILPLTIRSLVQTIRQIPRQIKSSAYGLGLSQSSVVLKVLLPLALPGLSAGILLGVGRALAETAALLYTSGYVMRQPESIFDSGRSLSVHIYDLAMNIPGAESRAYASALVLIILLMLINFLAKLAMNLWQQSLLGSRYEYHS